MSSTTNFYYIKMATCFNLTNRSSSGLRTN